MKKGTFFEDTFEKALEAGQSMAKSGAQQIKQTFNPANMIKNAFHGETGGRTSAVEEQSGKTAEVKGVKGSTAIDFAKLQEKYQNQDKSKTDALRNRLFQMVKSGDEKIMMEKKQKEEEKKRQEAYQEHEKRERKLRNKDKLRCPANLKVKNVKASSPQKKKKAPLPSVAEIKPSTGKQ